MGRHGWNSGARRWRLTALLGVGVAALALVVTLINTLPGGGASTSGTSRDGDKVHGTPVTSPERPEPYVGWGFTHTQYSADEGSGAATGRVEELLAKNGGLPQNQHIMGWGADNPEPVKGRYDFAAMDRRIDFGKRQPVARHGSVTSAVTEHGTPLPRPAPERRGPGALPWSRVPTDRCG